MSVRIPAPPIAQTFQPATPAAVAKTADAGAAKDAKAAKAKEEAAKVGRDFEAILVRQMLTQTKVAGKAGGYADMAVEALASSISAAGGLGMSQAIAAALGPHAHPPPPGPKPLDSLTKQKVTEK